MEDRPTPTDSPSTSSTTGPCSPDCFSATKASPSTGAARLEPETPPTARRFTAGPESLHERLDVFLAREVPALSRSAAARLVREGNALVNGRRVKPSHRLAAGEEIAFTRPPPPLSRSEPEPLPLDMLHEDPSIVVLNKAAGMTVHPAPGHPRGTLVNALLHRFPDLAGVGGAERPGIVHRLDRETSGVMVVARTAEAYLSLSRQFREHSVAKEYLALVVGEPPAEGRFEAGIGRHPVDRKRMSTRARTRREALTLWKVEERLPGCSLVRVNLKTGRTHQIRVHFSEGGWPIAGDPVYGGRKAAARISGERARACLQAVTRQMLHAQKIAFTHPATGETIRFEAPLAEDMARLLADLREAKGQDRR